MLLARSCSIPACERVHRRNGYCTMHSQRAKKGLPLEHPGRLQRGAIPQRKQCKHPDRPSVGQGLCASCYQMKWVKEHPGSNTAAEWQKRNPEKHRIQKRRAGLKRLGCTPEMYAQMWEKQSGKCANTRCDRAFPLDAPDMRRALQVDHDHKTGRIRSLLCPRCNTALGHVDDDVQRLQGLIEYLEVLN